MSVGSLDLQLRFVAWELEERGMLSKLQAVRSVREASDLVLFRYEAPLDTSANIQTVRCGLSMTFYNRFAGTLSQGQKDILEVAANPAAYGIPESNVGGLQWVKLVYEASGVPLERTCCAYHSGREARHQLRLERPRSRSGSLRLWRYSRAHRNLSGERHGLPL